MSYTDLLGLDEERIANLATAYKGYAQHMAAEESLPPELIGGAFISWRQVSNVLSVLSNRL